MDLHYFDRKLKDLASDQGFSSVKKYLEYNSEYWLESASVDASCLHCGSIRSKEIDCVDGYCPTCHSHLMMSVFEMAKKSTCYNML